MAALGFLTPTGMRLGPQVQLAGCLISPKRQLLPACLITCVVPLCSVGEAAAFTASHLQRGGFEVR